MNLDVLAIVVALAAIVTLFYMRQTSARSVGKEYFYGIVGMFLLLALVAVVIDFYNTAPTAANSAVYNANIVSNTLYQNGNYSTLYVYADTSAFATAYVGANAASLVKVANESAVFVGGIGVVQYNLTETVAVPPYYFYLFNYSDTKFVAEYSNTT